MTGKLGAIKWRSLRWTIEANIPEAVAIAASATIAACTVQFVSGLPVVLPVAICACVVIWGAIVFEFGFRRGWW